MKNKQKKEKKEIPEKFIPPSLEKEDLGILTTLELDFFITNDYNHLFKSLNKLKYLTIRFLLPEGYDQQQFQQSFDLFLTQFPSSLRTFTGIFDKDSYSRTFQQSPHILPKKSSVSDLMNVLPIELTELEISNIKLFEVDYEGLCKLNQLNKLMIGPLKGKRTELFQSLNGKYFEYVQLYFMETFKEQSINLDFEIERLFIKGDVRLDSLWLSLLAKVSVQLDVWIDFPENKNDQLDNRKLAHHFASVLNRNLQQLNLMSNWGLAYADETFYQNLPPSLISLSVDDNSGHLSFYLPDLSRFKYLKHFSSFVSISTASQLLKFIQQLPESIESLSFNNEMTQHMTDDVLKAFLSKKNLNQLDGLKGSFAFVPEVSDELNQSFMKRFRLTRIDLNDKLKSEEFANFRV